MLLETNVIIELDVSFIAERLDKEVLWLWFVAKCIYLDTNYNRLLKVIGKDHSLYWFNAILSFSY